MDNRSFWDDRYRSEAWLGSGPGSRGVAAHYKADLLRQVLGSNPIRSVMDIGCGDLCWILAHGQAPAWLADVDYTGIDISEVIVQRNARVYPRGRYLVHDLVHEVPGSRADLTLCFDVLLHQVERADFTAALGHLLEVIDGHGLVSYINPAAPEPVIPDLAEFDTDIERRFQEELREKRARKAIPYGQTEFFGALPELVAAMRPDLRVRTVGRYRYQEVYEISAGDWLNL